MSPTRLSREAFDVLVAQSGLPLDEAKREELYAAYGHLEQMKSRVRARVAGARESEPAHVFRPLDQDPER